VGGGREFEEGRAAVEGINVHWRKCFVSNAVAIAPAINGEARGSHGDVVARLGHAVNNGDGTTTVSSFTRGR
jgi:hypothetical protein